MGLVILESDIGNPSGVGIESGASKRRKARSSESSAYCSPQSSARGSSALSAKSIAYRSFNGDGFY
jgi:hypothetical protein